MNEWGYVRLNEQAELVGAREREYIKGVMKGKSLRTKTRR
jgi:hypothetical protein